MKKHTGTFFSFMFALIISAFTLTLAAGCSKAPTPAPVPQKTVEQERAENLQASADNRKLQEQLETQRSTALNNLTVAANDYMANNPRYQPASNWRLVSHTDDKINESCPQGSGWAWGNFMNNVEKTADGKPQKMKVWCSVYSRSIGCFLEDDFKSGPYAGQAAKCNKNIPFPSAPF